MPLILAALAIVLLVALGIALIPLSLVMRYRAGTARRLARRWVLTINVVMLAVSSALFLVVAAITNIWVPAAFTHAAAGLAGGAALGVIGLWASRWESTPLGVYYTPNRWLVLALTVVVSARILYGFWRAWHAWQFRPDDTSWLAAAGAAGSLAAGAVVLGYYSAYWMGVRQRADRAGRPA